MSQNDLTQLEDWISLLEQKLSAQQQRQLSREIAIKLRAAQRKRVQAQRNPDGSPFAPRKKPKPREINRRRQQHTQQMFAKIVRPRYLKARGQPNEATVAFTDRRTERIARIHQFGLRGQVNAKLSVRYPMRSLLGLTQPEKALIQDLIFKHLEAAQY